MNFDKQAFDISFPKDIATLAKSEKVTKETLRELSRNVLAAHHTTQDVSYMNKLIAVLTPVNRKVATLFFTEFSGFRQTDGVFTKKDKANYDKAHEAAIIFLEDPLNNIWTWAEREVAVEKKEFDIKQVTAAIERFNKKATDNGMTQADVLRAVLSAGFEMETLFTIMGEMEEKAAVAPEVRNAREQVGVPAK